MKKKYKRDPLFEPNFINLTKSNIFIEFVISDRIENLIPEIKELLNQIYCFKLSESFSCPYVRYKIIIDYSNIDLVLPVLNLIIAHITNPFVLKINSNRSEPIINGLVKLNCINGIDFGKQFNTNKYNQIQFIQGIKSVIYYGKYIANLKILPVNLDSIEFAGYLKINSNIMIEVPSNLKKIIYSGAEYLGYRSKSKTIILLGKPYINKILIINTWCKISYYDEIEPDCIVLLEKPTNLSNVSNKIKMLHLFGTKSIWYWLDLLPDSIETIMFYGFVKSNLSNLPAGTKTIGFVNNIDSEDFEKLSELPDSVETIYFGKNNLKTNIQIKKLPIGLKQIQLETNKITKMLIDSIKKYKQDNNLNFDIVYVCFE